ncbi:MAG: glycosyltransferase family 39 protein [Bacteroidales bacterium]|nr:glycosyltransferase family 39 protein [Bacteroidales bacterium]
MGTKLLRHISIIGVGVYLLALITISLVFNDYALQLKWVLWGMGEVLFFFVLTTLFYPRWKNDDPKRFRRKVFWTAFGIRALYAFLICYYYYYQTGKAFEYNVADSIWYHRTGVHLSRAVRQGYIRYVFQYLRAYTMGFSDQGYTLWLTLIYTIFGPNLLTPRLFKALMSGYLCIVVYKLGTRTFGERTGKLAAVMCAFMPILVQICGLHTKEMEMIFLSLLALERMDYLIRSKKYTAWNIAFPILLTGLTFGFRTIVGMCLIFAFLVFIMLSPNELVGKKGKIISVSTIVLVFFVFLLTGIGNEMRIIYRLRFVDLNVKTEKYEALGFKHAELAHSKYLAPGAFVLPLAPMVEESPEHNKMIHGSTYVKNFLAFFAMLAIVVAFRQKKWRDFSLIGAYELSYLAIIMLSFAANMERYHQPAIPLLVLMAAYAMTHLRRKDLILFYVYCGLLYVALFVWNWLKLSARGLV